MDLLYDPDRFDQLQAAFVREMVERVKLKLQEAGLSGTLMEDITAHIAFSLASALDDTSDIEVDGLAIHPYLTFRDADDNLVHSGDNSYLYEFVTGALKAQFEQ